MTMKLSKNFSVAELSKSEAAVRLGLDNTPSLTVIDNLQALVDAVLQPVRDKFGPITVTSGYRSPAVNKTIGGSATSDHCKGQAADFEVMGMPNKELATWIRDNLEFTQLILEFPSKSDPNAGWVHCSYDKSNLKKQVLTAVKVGGKTVYQNGLN
jgi:zinc D-Ala-D-Ala carboxypeptidase